MARDDYHVATCLGLPAAGHGARTTDGRAARLRPWLGAAVGEPLRVSLSGHTSPGTTLCYLLWSAPAWPHDGSLPCRLRGLGFAQRRLPSGIPARRAAVS